uniref:Uncharacterized protein n=1 Tax=Parascaris equorum TaxID=6256 RepID=A0A914RLK6_PAREQ
MVSSSNVIGELSVRIDAICHPPWDPLPMIQSMFMQYSEIVSVLRLRLFICKLWFVNTCDS